MSLLSQESSLTSYRSQWGVTHEKTSGTASCMLCQHQAMKSTLTAGHDCWDHTRPLSQGVPRDGTTVVWQAGHGQAVVAEYES